MAGTARIELLGVLAAGAAGSGVHAALAPEHLHEWAPLGASFLAAAVLFAITVAALALRPEDRRPITVLAALFGAVAIGYVATRLAALPPLDPEREPFDALGICTSAVEAVGLLLAIHIQLPRTRLSPASSGGTP
jgi:CHASE2 domain-containing sensor protein